MRGGRIELKLAIAAIVLVWAVLVVFGAARARADGLPVVNGVDTTREGVLTADGDERLLAIPGGDGRTTLLRINAASGVVRHSRSVEGEFVVPGVSLDGDTAGLSADGRTLVLIRPRSTFPQRSTSLLLVDPETLRIERRIDLDGDFSFDALSPDGRLAYLVHYKDPRDPTDYSLRRLLLPSGRLVPGSLLPDNEPDEEMRGFPMSRISGLGARWEYTLYDGGATYTGGHHAGTVFVHALDTVAERTLCIDVEWIRPREADRIDLRMSSTGEEVELFDPRAGVVARIDAETGEAREVSEPLTAGAPEEGGGSTLEVLGAGLLIGGIGMVGFAAWRRRSAMSEKVGKPT